MACQAGFLNRRRRPPHLDLYVTRENLLTNVMTQISKLPAAMLKLPLVVHFASNAVPEEGVDQGGIAKVYLSIRLSKQSNHPCFPSALNTLQRTADRLCECCSYVCYL